MEILNKNTSWFILLIFIFFSCSKKSDVLTNKKNEEYRKYIYLNDTILCIYGNFSKKDKTIDTTIFYKKGNDYFEDIYNPIEGSTFIKSKLSFSINKDTCYNYNVIFDSLYCKISKIGKNRFQTVYAKYDSLRYKYKRIFYYDNNYRIYKIEEIDNDEKIIFEK
jgi:hypothetical protein